jgi:hypothetical protein
MFYAISEKIRQNNSHYDEGAWGDATHDKLFIKGQRRAIRCAKSRSNMSRSAFNNLLKQEWVQHCLDDQVDELLAH